MDNSQFTLENISSTDKVAIFDLDHTLLTCCAHKFCMTHGLAKDKEEFLKDLKAKLPKDIWRKKRLEHYIEKVTQELSGETGIPEGKILDEDTYKKLGEHFAKKMRETQFHYPNAYKMIEKLLQMEIKIIVLTGAPWEIADSVMKELIDSKYHDRIYVIGADYSFEHGRASMVKTMYDSQKSEFTKKILSLGATIVFGAGNNKKEDPFLELIENNKGISFLIDETKSDPWENYSELLDIIKNSM